MKKYILLSAITLAFFAAKAQTYSVTHITYNPVPWDSGIQVVSAVDDQWGQVLGIGFDFYFFGVPYQSLIVGTNGQLSFTTSNAGALDSWNISGPIPTTTPADAPNNIMFPWQDIDCTNQGKVRHQVYGTPPNRRFVVTFDSIPLYGSPMSVNNSLGCTSNTFSGQVILYEGSSNIEMHIRDKDTCTAWNNGWAVEGIQNAAGTTAYSVPGRDATVWTAHNDAWRFSPDSVWQGSPNLNRISGRVFADLNGNCLLDSSDYALRNKPVIFTNDSTSAQSYIYTDLQGYYSKRVDTGHYSFTTANLANHLYASNCPASGSYHVYFPNYYDSSDNHLFADTLSQSCSSLIPGLWVSNPQNYLGAINSCDTAVMILSCANNGTQSDSVTLVLTLNDSTRILASSVPYAQSGNMYYFLIGRLNPGFDSAVNMTIKVGCDTSGTLYCFDVQARGVYSYQCIGGGNTDNLCGALGQPFDPNAMYVSSITHPAEGVVPYLETGDTDVLSYLVTFQNTGTATAHNVELKIPLSARIDTNTLVPSISSFPYSWLVLHNTLIVDFTGINLPDTAVSRNRSEGFFKFRVNQAVGNIPGDSIIHKAGIYFDYNTPVNTNPAIVKIVSTDSLTTGLAQPNETGILLYPNPAHTSVELVTQELSQMRITDATGKLMMQQQLTALRSNFDISNWAGGIYLVTVNSGKYNRVLKFIRN